nr:MAG TPA: DNA TOPOISOMERASE IV, B SUBUNIT [Caudoviricetes sp.]
MGKLYDEKSIESLSPLEFTRLRPGVYVGSTEYSTQLLIEIVSNAVDEFKAGHGNKIIVTIKNDNTVIVEDNGQGFIPNAKRDDGKTVLEASFSVLNTSGKYSDDGVYEGTALGLNGIGSKLTTYLSHWLEVISHRDGKYEHIWFKEGVFEKRECGVWDNKNYPSGTLVQWQPSEEFFTHSEVDMPVIINLFKVIACLCPGLTIELNREAQPQIIFASKNGLMDLVDEAVKGKEILKNRLNFNFSDNKNKLDLVLTYTNSYSATIVPYVNTGLTDSGPHITQVKTILTREMNKFFREKGWLKDKDENLTGEDCQEGVYIAFNVTAPGVAYDAQTKSRVVKLDMKPFTSAIAEELQYWLAANEKDVKKIADKALNARKAREAARKARDAARGVKGKKETGLKAKMQISNKFIDCTNKNPKNRNLLVVEGLSAGASAVEARNPKTDCIYMLRGKIVSPLKTAVEKILANQEMSDIVRVIGAGFGSSFDVNKMNFDKVVITSDADSDGADIELLLITFFYTYMRPLVEAGKLYRAVTPLYIIRHKGNEYYCYTEDELIEWKNTHTGSYDLLRAKGLGELNPEDLQKVCFMNERYKRISISDAEKTTELLNVLMGSAVEPRKQYIYDNANELGFNFE